MFVDIYFELMSIVEYRLTLGYEIIKELGEIGEDNSSNISKKICKSNSVKLKPLEILCSMGLLEIGEQFKICWYL